MGPMDNHAHRRPSIVSPPFNNANHGENWTGHGQGPSPGHNQGQQAGQPKGVNNGNAVTPPTTNSWSALAQQPPGSGPMSGGPSPPVQSPTPPMAQQQQINIGPPVTHSGKPSHGHGHGHGQGHSKQNASLNSFQQFKRQAQEKADRQRLLIEQQEKRRRQSEEAERARMRQEQEQRRARAEEEALEKARQTVKQEQPPPPIVKGEHLSSSPSSSPGETVMSGKSEREIQRMREQERRRREAMKGQIDMNLQAELLATFEENNL